MLKEIQLQNAAAMIAHAEGKSIQFKALDEDQWNYFDQNTEPNWDFKNFEYRPKPEPKTRQWSMAEDVPVLPCYIRGIQSEGLSWALVLSAGTGGINVAGDGGCRFVPYDSLELYLCSTDRKTWQKCEVSE